MGPAYKKEVQRDLFFDVGQFLWYYGNETFKDGDIGYWYFVYLSQQIPALEAKSVFVTMEGSVLAQGADDHKIKKRLRELQNLVTYGVQKL